MPRSDWWADYIGLPFEIGGRTRDGLDCWGLVRLVYAEQLGRELPPLVDYSADAISDWVGEEVHQWQKVKDPQPFAVALFRMGGSAYRWHVGIVIDSETMLHITKGADAVAAPLAHHKNQFHGFYVL